MLTALGIWDDSHWEMLLQALYRKGIPEDTTRLLVSDRASGLAKALARHGWAVPHQRCIFHKIKNIADHLQYTGMALT